METKLKSQTATYPKILGIKYNPQDFCWNQTATSKWSWSANSEALQALQDAGGVIQKFDTATMSQATRALLDEELQANQDDQFMVDYAAKPWQGLEIKVPEQVELQDELQLDIMFEEALPINFTVVLNVGKASRVRICRQIHFPKATANFNLLTCGKVAGESKLELVDQLKSTATNNILFISKIHCQKDAQLDWSLYPDVKGKLLGKCTTLLEGRGSTARFNVGQYGRKDDWIGIQGLIEHRAPDTFSRIKMRGVLYENAQVYFTSTGKINRGARGANAAQESRLMTVEPSAKGSVNPLLIIDENDVQAGHAASVGQYDEEALYYLLSRGLPENVAKQILIDNFMEPVLPKKSVEK